MNSSQLLQLLQGLPIPEARWLDATGSTNDDAAAWAARGAPDGCLVAADRQESGRGRMGRGWVTRPGGALAFSLILRLRQEERSSLPLFSPLGGLAVAVALEKLGVRAEVKWPNDVLLERRKVCGVLAEAAWIGSELQALVLGIGVNIAPFSMPPAEGLIFPATCVEDHLTEPVDRFGFLRSVLEEIFTWREIIGTGVFLDEWGKRLAFKDEKVSVIPPNEEPVVGTLIGIDAQGNLRIREENGAERTITAGDVTLRPQS